MTDFHHGNAAFEWAKTFLGTLREQGVRHIVISPGSRSTPLTLAAASNNHIEKHVVLDERSAAFTALGIGKATNVPAALVCTSGTALANYYPAVIEARQSGVPMILATADRPPHLRATGANQAIDQLKLFGDYPVFFHEVGEPSTEDKDLKRLRLLGRQAVSLSQEKRGPVHLNFPFRKPLQPDPATLVPSDRKNEGTSKAEIPSSWAFAPLLLSNSLGRNISEAEKPIIIVGPLAPHDDTETICQLAEQTRAPILSETSIDHPNCITGFSGFLRNEHLLENFEPDLILRFGFQPTSKSLEWGLTRWSPDLHYHFASTHDWQNATLSDTCRILWKGQAFKCEGLSSSSQSEWLEQWQSVEQNFNRYLSEAVEEESSLTDGGIYNFFTPRVPEDHFIAVSNSFPARDIYLFGQQPAHIPLFMNRGASGIDGVTSTAVGLSLGLDRPGVLFTGDLAFLHDTNALLNNDILEHSLTIIVINNSGGSIFRMLPIGQYKKYFTSYFETPQSADIGKLASAYGIPYRKIDSLSDLRKMDRSDWVNKQPGLSVVECQTDADASMELREKMWDFKQ